MKCNNIDQLPRSQKKNTSLFLAFILSISFLTPCLSQSALYLQHREKPDLQKKVSLKKEYKFKTSDTTLYRHRIASFSSDSLMLFSEHTSAFIKININDIYYLEKEKKYGAFEILGTIGMIALSITPVIWATEGNEEALGMLQVSGVFLACSAPFLAIKEIGRKKDTKNKWEICVSKI